VYSRDTNRGNSREGKGRAKLIVVRLPLLLQLRAFLRPALSRERALARDPQVPLVVDEELRHAVQHRRARLRSWRAPRAAAQPRARGRARVEQHSAPLRDGGQESWERG
jgi:hypothetical protein